MIRTNTHTAPARRIAIIRMPRPQTARLGSVGPTPAPSYGWTTISDEAPTSADNWQGFVLMQQAAARSGTPGTLTYTPASDTPAPNVAPWNSWLNPNCMGAPVPFTPDLEAEAAPDYTRLWLLLGLLGAAASAKYLLHNDTRR